MVVARTFEELRVRDEVATRAYGILVFEDLVAKGITPAALERVHAPLGYNIGSQTVPEIAVSIVAELIACRNVGGTDAARWSWSKHDRLPRSTEV